MWPRSTRLISNNLGPLLLILVEAFLLCLYPGALVFDSSLVAGGDTPSHFLAASALRDSMLSGGSIFTWIHGNYAGFPIFLNYFPLPFFIMSLLSLCMPLTIAFKLVTVLPVAALPAAIYACLRQLGQRGFVCTVGSALSLPFLVMEGNSMWGGNIASTLAGEFCFGISLVLAVYLTGRLFSDLPRGKKLFTNGFVEGLVALSSGYPLLQVGFGSFYFLLRKRFLPYVAAMHCIAFGMISFWILPLFRHLPWGTPFNYAWKIESWREPLPPALLPALLGIALGWSTRWWPGTRPPVEKEERTRAEGNPQEYLWWNMAIALLLFALAPSAGLVDIRFLPFAQVILILLGAVGWGFVLERLRYRAGWALVLVLTMTAAALATAAPMRSWMKWNYSGFEAKPLWKAFEQVNLYLKGNADSPRVIYEHSELNDGAGTVRAFELLPHFSGRSTLEGLYMQSSINAPFIFYLQSEISQTPSCPFPGYCYSRFDPDRAARHMRLFNVSQVIVATEPTALRLDRSPEYRPEIAFPPYRVYSVAGPGQGYIIPLHFVPFRISPENWKRTQFEWFRKSSLEVPLVVEPEDGRGSYWRNLPLFDGNMESMPRLHLENSETDDVRAAVHLEKNRITIDTSRPDHPLWLSVSYHPDWRIAEGEGEIYLASPAFMLVVPHTARIVLKFDTSRGVYALGLAVSLVTWIFVIVAACFRSRRRPVIREHSKAVSPVSPLIWLLLVLVICGLLWKRDERDPLLLYDKALKVFESAGSASSAEFEERLAGAADGDTGTPLGKARRLFLLCLKKFPSSPVVEHAARYTALSYMLERKWDEAVRFYETFLPLYPDTRIYPEALYDIAVCKACTGAPEDARRYLWQVLTFYPDSGSAAQAAESLTSSTPPGELLSVAKGYFLGEDFARAYSLSEALSSGQVPESVRAESILLCAYCRFRQNRWEQAAKLFTDYLNGYPGHPGASAAFMTLGQCYLFTGHYREARTSLTSALALEPGLAHRQPFVAIMTTVEGLEGSGS